MRENSIMLKFFTLFIIIFLQTGNIEAKTKKWNFEVEKYDNNLNNCITILDIKTKAKSTDILKNFLYRNVPVVVEMFNNCGERLKGWFDLKFLDIDDFLILEETEEFSIGESESRKISFKAFFNPYRGFKKVRKLTIKLYD